MWPWIRRGGAMGVIIWLLGWGVLRGEDRYTPDWESLDRRPIPSWFADAKFGIFIHWGVYSVPAWREVSRERYASYAEWYYARVMYDEQGEGAAFHRSVYGENFQYRDFAPMFRAELFDPDFWAGLFERSGARYVVLTAKHHDGFCLWPTASPFKKGWNSRDVGPHSDLVGDLSRAVRARGLRFGLYYSIIEWESTPTHRTESGWFLPRALIERHRIPEDSYIDRHMIPQLKELVTAYQPAVIFGDGGEWDRSAAEWKTLDFLAWLYNHAPNRDEVVVNDRFGRDMPGRHGDYFSSEYQDAEDSVGGSRPWEESRGVGGSYGFNRAENLDDYRTSRQLIHELADIVSRGGNLLLNVGPTADGRIPVIMQQRLADMGGWLSVNGEAIYGTRPWRPDGKAHSGSRTWRATRRGNDLYVICLTWPGQPLRIDGLPGKDPDRITLLGTPGPVSWTREGESLLITPPGVHPGDQPCESAWTFKLHAALR